MSIERHRALLLLFALSGCGQVTAASLELDADAAAPLEHDAAAEREGPADAAGEATQQTPDGTGESKPIAACAGLVDTGGPVTYSVCADAPTVHANERCATCESPTYRLAGCRRTESISYLCVQRCADCPTM